MATSRYNGGFANGREMTRAERFEEEKRRIVDSCFSKKDSDGSLLETYITHIKITEFSSHPNVPPPPEARTPQIEKPRVIIVAVRKSGRVRVHKSKENANGTFSIGKTWDLNDLSAIESFTDPAGDAQKRRFAGDTGFIVTIGKPYFWQAHADKEKKFFIASLIKIYGKYTAGKMPNLIGFDQRELDQVLGSRKPPVRAPPPNGPPNGPPTGPPTGPLPSRPEPPHPIQGIHSSSNEANRFQPNRPPSRPTTSSRNAGPPNGIASSPSNSIDSGLSNSQPPVLRRFAANNQSQDSFSTARSDDAISVPPRSRGGMNGPGAFGRFGDRDATKTPPPHPHPPAQFDLPDRKRPPMDPLRPQEAQDMGLVPAPLMSPRSPRREPQPPPRSNERMSPRKNMHDPNSISQSSLKEKPTTAILETNGKPLTEEKPISTPVSPIESPTVPPEEDNRPGLGPMIKTKGSQVRLANILWKAANAATAFQSVDEGKPNSKQKANEKTGSSPATPVEPSDQLETRPGLGPMIKSQASQAKLANTLWKAASAAAAFQPRPGGAGERLMQGQSRNEGPDGITSVVPAPPRTEPEPPRPAVVDKSSRRSSGVPEVKITVPGSSRPSSVQSNAKDKGKGGEPTKKSDAPRDAVVTGNDADYLATLGVGANLLNGEAAEFAKWLDHFGWVPGESMRSHNFDEIKLEIDRELNKAQAGGWVARFEEEDERIDSIKTGLDVAIAECDELDNLLTLYSVELSTLSEDIAYIEAQGQGLQVQAANQKLLKKELESLLDTCAIQQGDLEPLELAPFDSYQGLEDIETTLVTLYKAMMKIDPSMGGKGDETGLGDQQSAFNSDYGKMRIVQEKKELYIASNARFLARFQGFMEKQFAQATAETKKALEGALSKKVDAVHHDVGRELLWRYSPLMLYARDMDLTAWNGFVQNYQEQNCLLYRREFKEVLEAWKRNAKRSTGDEAELLFTSLAEKQEQNTLATARKLTVKRSQTLLGRSLTRSGEGHKPHDKGGSKLPYEVFAGVMDDLLPLVEMEQNFIVDFFHATTLENSDFPDVVTATTPKDRRGGDLRRHRLMEPDRDLARRVTKAMEMIFSFLEQELQTLVNWVLSQDPLQGVGVLATLERKQAEVAQSNQDFLNSILQKIHSNLQGRFSKFVEDQIRAIEDTKVKIKKRKGVISFVRVFPHFSTAVENMMASADINSGARRTIDKEYDRIIRSMFDSLKVIARENPATLTSAGADPEDKEALNFHILLIENMNHFIEEVDTRGLEILEEWKNAAATELAEHMSLYLNAVMRRPLGKLLEYLENIELQLAGGKSPSTIAAQPSNAKTIFNKILSSYDGREVRKGVETLRRRVEKHFNDAEEDGKTTGSRTLVNRALQECEKFYNDVEVRISTVTTTVYGGDVLFEWPRAEVKSAFSGR